MDSSNSYSLKINCPACLHAGTFDSIPGLQDLVARDSGPNNLRVGARKCPDLKCQALVYFKCYVNGTELETYPSPAVKLDTTNLPAAVLRAFEEAIRCYHSGCFVAAALMVRKALEEVCNDLGFKGKTLEDRINELKTKVTLPVALLESLHDLRLLGNDAAHIESRHFSDVGKDELNASIEVMKELLKGLYQYQALKEKLESLKKSKS